MTVYLPVRHSHCTRARFTILVPCSSELAGSTAWPNVGADSSAVGLYCCAVARRLKSRHPFVPAAQQHISFSDNAEWADNPVPYTPEWPFQEEPGSGLTASARVSDVSAPACTNEVWPPLRSVSLVQKSKPSTMLSSNVQSIDLPTAWWFWTMRQPNGCSTPAPKSSAAKQWIKEELAQTKEDAIKNHRYCL